jgi:hypothetical protein
MSLVCAEAHLADNAVHHQVKGYENSELAASPEPGFHHYQCLNP